MRYTYTSKNDYLIITWGTTTLTNLNKLQQQQSKAPTKFATKRNY